jgi:hypothetical protein
MNIEVVTGQSVPFFQQASATADSILEHVHYLPQAILLITTLAQHII